MGPNAQSDHVLLGSKYKGTFSPQMVTILVDVIKHLLECEYQYRSISQLIRSLESLFNLVITEEDEDDIIKITLSVHKHASYIILEIQHRG